MEEIKTFFRLTLPSLEDNIIDELYEKCLYLGVETFDDLHLLDPVSDLENLPLIKRRKLNQALKKRFDTEPAISGRSIPTGRSTPTSPSTSSVRSGSSDDTFILEDEEGDLSSQSQTEQNAGSNWASNFQLPFDQFPRGLQKDILKGIRPKPSVRRQAIRILADEISTTCTNPGKASLRQIAEKLVSKYPAFKDTDENGYVVGCGYQSVLSSLQWRLINTQRVESANRVRFIGKETGNKKRLLTRDQYGCVNWQPDTLPEKETEDTQKTCQEWLKTEWDKTEWDNETVEKYVRLTFATQRRLLNRRAPTPTITEIVEGWPFLFEAIGLCSHFEELMGFNISSKWDEEVKGKNKGKRIVDFIKARNITDSSIYRSLICEIRDRTKSCKNNQAFEEGVVLMLVNYFHEDIESLIRLYKVGTCTKEIESDSKVPLTPVIAAVGEGYLTTSHIFLIVERRVVNDHIDNISKALQMMFASYYMLNLAYNEKVAATLEFIQRSFVGINPDKGTKRRRSTGGVHPKVIKLFSHLKDYESEWSFGDESCSTTDSPESSVSQPL